MIASIAMSTKVAIRQTAKRLGFNVARSRPAYQTLSLDLYPKLYSQETLDQRPFYNVGAGSFRHIHWTNVDKRSDWYAQAQADQTFIAYDLLSLEPLPINTNSAEIVYTSHTLEHIPNESAQWFFSESYRALKPGGILRITVPDAQLFYQALLRDDRLFDNMTRIYTTRGKARKYCLDRPANELSSQQLFLWRIATSTSIHHVDGSKERITDEQLDQAFQSMPFEKVLDFCTSKCDPEVQMKYPGNHVNWWTYKKFARMLPEAGFKTILHSAYGQSTSPLLRDTALFDNTHPEFSVYVEAIKD